MSPTERRPPVPPLAGEDHVCVVCRLSYPQVTVAAAVEVIHGVPMAARTAVTRIPASVLRRRPAGDGWSVTEYLCHLRDVYVTYTIRLHRARTEDRPALEPMLNDLRARRFRYNERAAAAVLDEIGVAVSGFGEEVSHVRAHQWSRVVTRLPGEERTALWLVRQAMHEGVHHLDDIRGIGDALMDSQVPPG